MAALMRLADKRDLTAFLAGVTAAHTELRHRAWGPIDAARTYTANCRDAPAAHLVLLPGFGTAAIERDGAAAAEAFARFCRSQFGQRGGLTLWFAPMPAPVAAA